MKEYAVNVFIFILLSHLWSFNLKWYVFGYIPIFLIAQWGIIRRALLADESIGGNEVSSLTQVSMYIIPVFMAFGNTSVMYRWQLENL